MIDHEHKSDGKSNLYPWMDGTATRVEQCQCGKLRVVEMDIHGDVKVESPWKDKDL